MSDHDTSTALAQLEAAQRDGQISVTAAENIRTWLTEPYLSEYADQVADHLAQGKFKELDDAFWTVIPFGTGGRRGKMYPIGTNAINDRTIGESAQGLADYIKEQKEQLTGKPLACAIAYDTRHRSRHFAELCAQIMAAAGYQVYFLDGCRSTPELSFAVRYKECACGIMITASHNPPSDNAVKVYGPTGGQLLPPHDEQSIERMRSVKRINRTSFSEAMKDGKIVYCQDEVDRAFVEAVLSQSVGGPRDLKIIYSPLHGVGASAVCPVLEGAGFQAEVFSEHAAPDPDFTNVPGHVSNPENPQVFDAIIEHAQQIGADLIMATDPDGDRLGIAVPLGADRSGPWTTLTGNQIGALLADFLLGVKKEADELTPEHYLVKTLVTTELIRRVCDSYGVRCEGNLLVGFKWIGGVMEERGTEKFVLGTEESYGFLAGGHVRDKDGAVAALLVAELAARCNAEEITLFEKLDTLLRQHGCHSERQFSIQMPGEQGMEDMKRLMARFRQEPPKSIAGIEVAGYRDYLSNKQVWADGTSQPLDGPTGDLIILDLADEGNYVAVRPSGTEPKVKFYMFCYDPPGPSAADLDGVKQQQQRRLADMDADLRQFAGV